MLDAAAINVQKGTIRRERNDRGGERATTVRTDRKTREGGKKPPLRRERKATDRPRADV